MKTIKKHIYISHPITGYDLYERRQYAEQIKSKVQNIFNNEEWRVMEPFDILPYRDEYEYRDYMKADLYVLYGSEIIVMCKDWKSSKGCRDEFYVAVNQGKEIWYVDDEMNIQQMPREDILKSLIEISILAYESNKNE